MIHGVPRIGCRGGQSLKASRFECVAHLPQPLTRPFATREGLYYIRSMKTITVRLPEALAADIESESKATGTSKSDVVRSRLESAAPPRSIAFFDLASDLIGSVDDSSLPRDISSRKKVYLKERGYGKSSSG